MAVHRFLAPGMQQIDLSGKPVYVPTQLTYPA